MRKKSKTKPEKLKKSFSLKIMKVYLALFIVGFCSTLSAVNTYSQTANMTVKLSNAKVETLFAEIEKNSNYVVLYKKGIVENKTVTVNTKNESVEALLNRVLPPLNLSYQINGNQIIVIENRVTPEVEEVEQDPTITASGTIADSSGEPLPGVSVVEKGNVTNGTMTDIDGKFSLKVAPNATLVLSYVGFEAMELKAGTNMNVVMKEQDNTLDDVVVVGYGVQKKVNLTGSISSVTSKDLVGRTNSNLLQSLQGTAPGVTIVSRPGSTPSINVRGRGNLGTSEPLYVIDGAISTSTTFANLDPNSIESVSILKDAASSAIYGARAAYGVLLVTTKQGAKDGLNINYDGLVGMKRATTKPKVVSSEWEARLTNEAAINAGQTAPISDDIIEKYRNGSEPDLYPNTNWYDLIFDDYAVVTSHTLSFNGTSGKTSYYTSLGYTYDDAFQPGQSTDRYNVNLNLSSQLRSWLKFRAGVKYTEYKLDKSTGDIAIQYLMQSPPSYVARQSNGEWGTVHGGANASSTFVTRNPLRKLEESGWTKRNHKTTVLDGALDVTLYEGLVFTGQIISDYFDYKNKRYEAFMPAVPRFLDNGATSVGGVSESKMEYEWYDRRRMTYNALLNYEWTKDIHSIKALAGSSFETYNYQQQKSSRKNFPTNNSQGLDGGSSTAADSEASGALTEEKLLSYFARLNYVVKDRYLFEANFRADASSRFHKDSRWGYFPSFSAGWRISEEDFMKNISWVNNLKLRASWGQLGNINNVNQYDYFAAYSTGYNYSFGDASSSGVYESKIPNQSLTWETVSMTDIGLDANFFGNKLGLVVDWYVKKTDDILLAYDVLKEVGAYTGVSQNLGRMDNKGLEFVISHNNRIGDFSYSIDANFTKMWNKVTYLGGVDNLAPTMWITALGQPIGTFYGYKTNGLLTQEDIDSGNYITDGTALAAGDVKYVDMDGDGKLTTADRTFIGKDVPDITYGFGLNLTYKNFDFNMFGQGISGAKVYFQMEAAHPFADNAPPREWHKGRWTTENPNPNAAYPRLLPQGNANYKFNTQDYSDFWLFSANYFRIKTMTLGYTIPKSVIKNWGINNLRVYLSSENPFTFRGDKRMKDYDPEIASSRGNLMTGTQSFNFGVNMSF